MACSLSLRHILAFFMCITPTESLAGLAIPPNKASRPFIGADVVSNGSRSFGGSAIFVAGIEGSLHNFWSMAQESCVFARKCKMLNDELMYAAWYQRNDFQAIKRAWHTMNISWSSGKLMLIRHDHVFSYPSGNPKFKQQFAKFGYPRLDNYYRAAGANGDALKVVVLLRRANDTLADVAIRMNHTASVLINAANELNTQLAALPPKSFMCLDTDHLFSFAHRFQRLLGNMRNNTPFFNYTRIMSELWPDIYGLQCPYGPDKCVDEELEKAVTVTREICHKNALGPNPLIGAKPGDKSLNNHLDQIIQFAFGEK